MDSEGLKSSYSSTIRPNEARNCSEAPFHSTFEGAARRTFGTEPRGRNSAPFPKVHETVQR